MQATERESQIVEYAESRSREAADIMTERERLEAESKGRRTPTAAKIATEMLRDDDVP